MNYIIIGLLIILIAISATIVFKLFNDKKDNREKEKFFQDLKEIILNNQIESLKDTQKSYNENLVTITKNIQSSLNSNNQQIEKNVNELKDQVQKQLDNISGQVEKRLADGFDKTHDVFEKVIQRINIIDTAQHKIKELSENVVQLQDVLSDKKSRGAFGEVQLNNIVRNILPENQVYFQKDLSNGTRVDCLIKMPENSNNIPIDSKFPLENYKNMMDKNSPSTEIKKYERLFKQDVKKHIDDISSKYILEGETSENAIMFLPAEAVFAEIHAYHYDLVEYSHKKKIVMTSPNTLVALLTTVKSILKDEATKKQVHIIQEHLGYLSSDFERFEKRFDALNKHIKQVNDDADKLVISGNKITSRFKQIEKVELKKEKNVKMIDQDIDD